MGHKDTENCLTFFVNGKKVSDNAVDPEWTLLYYLRTKLRLCGTKLGCGEGGCGACTVMVSKYDRSKKKVLHFPVNACLAPICSVHGTAVTTVEGIGTTKTRLHPVQERIAKSHGSQCGFCTPGIVMSMYTLLRTTPRPSMDQMEVAFQGNLCRCTGYRPIIEGCKSFTGCAMGENCCKLRKVPEEESSNPGEFTPYDPSQEPIFPPELKVSDRYDQQYLMVEGKNVTWYRPTKLQELLDLKTKHPQAKIVVGNTEIGVEVKFKNMWYPVMINLGQIRQLTAIKRDDEEGLTIGASTTLSDLEQALNDEIARLPEHRTRIFKAIVTMLNLFGSKQIRSVATIGGNIVTGSPISDLIPILMANKVALQVRSNRGTRRLFLDESFFVGYRKTVLEPDEVLMAITIPLTNADRYCYAYKQSRRRDDDIAIVNFALNVALKSPNNLIDDINLVFGGMSFKAVAATKTEKNLKGLPWNREMLDAALEYLLEDLPLDPGAPGGMVQYRRTLALSLFLKAFLAISADRKLPLERRDLSGIEAFGSKEYKSSQYYSFETGNQTVHRPLVHRSAYKQSTGEAVYCDDIPTFDNEVHLAFVLSTEAHARIASIDPSAALAMDGVIDFISAKDIPENKRIGATIKDEFIFYGDLVTSQGQIIGGIVAVEPNLAWRAAKKVAVKYERIEPVIVTIQDAIQHGSFFDHNPTPGRIERVMVKGDIEKVMEEAPNVLEGECKSGGQEHFCLETMSTIVVPKKEDGELDVYCTTQNIADIATVISETLDIDQNKIVVKVRRIGGGFGGKDHKPMIVAIPTAVAAVKLNRPVRCTLDRDEDIIMKGGRHPVWSRYKVAFDDDGKILGIDVSMYLNGGFALDTSPSVLGRAMTHIENVYAIPAIRVRGYVCKTNIPSNTAFRGYGAPQAMFVIETIVQEVATHLQKDIAELIELNLCQNGYITLYNHQLEDCTISRCFKECLDSSRYHEKLSQIERFNQENRFKKRGLSLVCSKYGVGFSVPMYSQAGALVMVYTDGSVLLSHGGVEMGQGILTKMIQIASTVLEIPVGKIHTMDTSTDKVPNTSSTAASLGSDLNGMAVLEACKTIKERLRPYKEANPDGPWESWVRQAYTDRTGLSATGFYKTPNFGYNWETNEGILYSYYTYGTACCEVEIDTLTGDHRVVKTDIVMDIGQSLNPAIDVGQIEGAFMQGYGLFVLEELVCSPNGTLYTRGPGTYKLPGFGDIPEEFNVSLLKGISNPRAVYSSKAVGEPPLFFGSSVYFAIKNAVKAARKDNGASTEFQLEAPATCERIRMACQDEIASKVKIPENGPYKPWGLYL